MINFKELSSSSFEQFLIDNSIDKQKQYMRDHPEQKEDIRKCAQQYLVYSSTQKGKNDLKVKAFFLLPKKMMQQLNIKLSTSMQKEFLKNVAKIGKIWHYKQLEKWGINVNLSLENNNTLLHIACQQGDEEQVRQLIHLGANIFAKNDEGSTPLHIVCCGGNVNLINLLLKNIPVENINQIMKKDKNNKTPFHYLCENGYVDMAKHLFLAVCDQFHFSDLKEISLASANGLNLIAKSLIDEMDDLNKKATQNESKIKRGDSLIHLLVRACPPNLELIKYLLSKKVNVEQVNMEGNRAIHLAVRLIPPSMEVLELLVKAKADVNASNEKGRHPLGMAIFKRPPAEEVIQFLINHKADVDALDTFGRSYRWLMQIFDLRVTFEPKHSKRDMEFERRQLLANSWSIKGETVLEGKTLVFGKGLGEWGHKKTIQLLKLFTESSSDFIDLKEACDLIENAYRGSRSDPDQIAQDFKEGKPLVFHPGWKGHKISISIVDDYLLISNRGQKRQAASIKAYKINRKAPLNFYDVSKLLVNIVGEDPEKEAHYFYTGLPQMLGYDPKKKDPICQIIEEKCRQSSQKMGSCWFTSPKTGILGVLLVLNLVKERKNLPPEEQRKIDEKVIDSFQAVYKYYSEFGKIQILKEYLEGDYPNPDFKLVGQVVKKYNSKNWKYVFDNPGFVKQTYNFLAQILGKNTEKSLPPLYTKAQIDEWIEDFKTKHNLDANFEQRSVIDPEPHLSQLGVTSY